ncbi:MAG: 2-hydroxyacyl-CoA dehydratase subunit D [Promethearchaeota archaeon]
MIENQMLSDVVLHITTLKTAGRKVYGIVGHGLIPEELIYAANGFPLRLSLVDKSSAVLGIEYLSPATCSFARSILGHFEMKNELYNKLDAIIGGNYCNGELCATELIEKYFKIPKINIVFPSTKNEFALKFMIAELNHFKEDIERSEGIQISDNEILKAIKLYNQERKLIQEIVKIQTENNFILSGVDCLNLIYKHFLYGIDASIENLHKVINVIKEKSTSKKGKKIIFAGNGVPIGDNIIQLIENHGLLVSKNFTWTGLDYYNSLVEENINPTEALAKYYINTENSGRMILSDNYLTDLIKIYKESNADGIIFYLIKYCSIVPSVVSKKLKQTLSDENIPYLEIEWDYGITADAQLHTRLQAFKEMIK